MNSRARAIPDRNSWLKATIVHAEAESVAATDRRQIVPLYDQLVRIQPSQVVQLNRAVGIAMRDGPEIGMMHIDAVLKHGDSWASQIRNSLLTP